ncbi:MAG: hypothetical protein ABWJ42_01575 [Sulfolobales archaeon]
MLGIESVEIVISSDLERYLYYHANIFLRLYRSLLEKARLDRGFSRFYSVTILLLVLKRTSSCSVPDAHVEKLFIFICSEHMLVLV